VTSSSSSSSLLFPEPDIHHGVEFSLLVLLELFPELHHDLFGFLGFLLFF
jgi:hypothetical protein